LKTTWFRASAVSLLLLFCHSIASAQTAPPQNQAPPPDADQSTRPATNTFFGDTGLWFVPTADVLPNGKWSVSGYRRGTSYIEGYTNVGDFAGTFGVGIKDRAEIFGSFLFDTRVDRDTRPLFTSNASFGGIVAAYPRMVSPWSGDQVGDFYLGAKVNLLSEWQQKPVSVAIRGMVKLPTAKDTNGVGTGKTDGSVDFIISKELAKVVETAGYAGWAFLGQPSGFTGPSGAFEWGYGLAFPSRNIVRVTAEITGGIPSSNSLTALTPLVGTDLSVSPLVSPVEKLHRATVGLTFQAPNGFFAGVGATWNVPTQAIDATFAEGGGETAHYWDYQARIGWHPGVRVYVPPPPPPPTPPPPPPPPVHNLSVQAACDPCTVEIGKSSTVTATVTDSQQCAVTYRWSAPSGTFAQATARQTLWTAGQQEGSVPVTVTVTCPTDNKTASDSVNIAVTRPPVRNYTFEDVHFDFDRYSLRPEATRILDDAVTAMRENPTLRLTIEGHTCNIGTAEYNLALGDRRANSVKDYLVSRGIPTDRLQTISYGEERPKYDNSREETRRLNRRAALVVRLQ